MGSGCSSPLKKLGGRRGKPRRESSVHEANGDKDDNIQEQDLARTRQPQAGASGALESGAGPRGQHKFVFDNETTEINDDHPSTASYYTDVKNQPDEIARAAAQDATRTREQTVSLSAVPNGGKAPSAAARAMGLSSSFVPVDRHLLVSPALSPAPSACHSPAPTSSGCAPTMLDLRELNEAFKTLTFGLPAQTRASASVGDNLSLATPVSRIQQPAERQNLDSLSGVAGYTHQQLVQTRNDLINYISVIFVTADSNPNQPAAQPPTSTSTTTAATTGDRSPPSGMIESIIANRIESSLKLFCDGHALGLKFLNLNYEHLCKSFHINNLLDATMNVIEREYRDNGQRLVVVTLSNNWANHATDQPAGGATSAKRQPNQSQVEDKRQLPTKIDAQNMNKLLNFDASQADIENADQYVSVLRKWYTQVGGTFYLNPIYSVYPSILKESAEGREEAWLSWLRESSILKRVISHILDNCAGLLSSDFKLKYLSEAILEFIMNESSLQKRTLLIRNYWLTSSASAGSGGNQLSTSQTATSGLHQQSSVKHRDASLNDLARLLADPNKLTLKRQMGEEELVKTINDWVIENFNKFVESIQENQILYGKHVPPFIDRKLFIELTCQRLILEHFLNNITESYERKCHNFYTNHILPILNLMSSGEVASSSTTDKDTNQQVSDATARSTSPTPEPKQLSTNHLVFISGPRGCGKSTLFAQMVRFVAQDLFNKAQIIYRFCGRTIDSLSPNRLLRSVCEQFCQTQNENITAASYIYSSQRGEIINALNKIVKMQNSLIFLDGIDQFDPNHSNLDWLCELDADPRIKIFVMLEVDSYLYKKVLSSYSDATFISLDNPSTSEWAQMLSSAARTTRLCSTVNLCEDLKNLDLSSTSPAVKDSVASLTYKDAGDVMSMCQVRRLNNEHVYPELSSKTIQNNQIDNLRNAQRVVISHLQYLIPPYQLCALFVAIDSSRNGLVETDIINIMTLISKSPKSNTDSATREPWKFSTTLFSYLKIQLQPWLVYILSDRSVKITLQRDFLKTAIGHYVPGRHPNIVNDVREILLDYFSRRVRPSRLSIMSAIKGDSGSMEMRDNVSPPESLWLATQASETMNLLILTDPAKAKEHILNKHHFFFQFFYGSMPEEFIEDFDRLKDISGRKPSYNEEFQCLVDYIRQSVYPLRYDGSQIYSQIHCRTFDLNKSGKFPKSKKFSDIITTAACPPIRNLLPISETSVNSFIKTRIGLAQPAGSANSQSSTSFSSSNASQQASGVQFLSQTACPTGQSQAKQKIFNIKDNHRHVIVVHPDKGSICVWDIYEERAVRTIHNIDQPRDLRMIDHKRAVVLCNRELRVYDLDSGNMLTKLKGVMNQKMPFFEVFGDSYVVALARNRMYVNMLNLNTGELETTFKVGEDRFLNSLLVSANGGICVCGDETQKPFPLLVWNLNERRLMYDLRLDRHEFITRMSAISDDGHFVVSVCKQIGDSGNDLSSLGVNGTSSGAGASGGASSISGLVKGSPNFIVVYDLNSGTLFKKWKPGRDTCAVAISLPANKSGKVINTIIDSSILIWDLSTGSKRHTLTGHTAPPDVIKVQNHRLFSMDSTCRDQSLRLWDIEDGYCLAVFTPDAPINSCQISTRGDALVCGFVSETRLSTLVLCKNETVSELVKKSKRRKSSKSLYIFDEPTSRKASS